GIGRTESTPICSSVYGVEDGDTCTSVTQKFNLSSDFYIDINPNVNCDNIFVCECALHPWEFVSVNRTDEVFVF
ncbi:unnamed protein product, partial [Ilex paraguariensis]